MRTRSSLLTAVALLLSGSALAAPLGEFTASTLRPKILLIQKAQQNGSWQAELGRIHGFDPAAALNHARWELLGRLVEIGALRDSRHTSSASVIENAVLKWSDPHFSQLKFAASPFVAADDSLDARFSREILASFRRLGLHHARELAISQHPALRKPLAELRSFTQDGSLAIPSADALTWAHPRLAADAILYSPEFNRLPDAVAAELVARFLETHSWMEIADALDNTQFEVQRRIGSITVKPISQNVFALALEHLSEADKLTAERRQMLADGLLLGDLRLRALQLPVVNCEKSLLATL